MQGGQYLLASFPAFDWEEKGRGEVNWGPGVSGRFFLPKPRGAPSPGGNVGLTSRGLKELFSVPYQFPRPPSGSHLTFYESGREVYLKEKE